MSRIVAVFALLSLATGCHRPRPDGDVATSPAAAPVPTPPVVGAGKRTFGLATLRHGLRTTIFHDSDHTPAADPPPALFTKAYYQRGLDMLVAYETPVRPGPRRPAIVWMAGGFDWGIGDSAWLPAPRGNDQSAAALRPDGLVLMLPALRGSNENPGRAECFLGEVDDIIAAAEHLAARSDVDPTRIYLGGHSTGGTLALLAAASTDRFRAIFAFGPVADPRQYGDECPAPGAPDAEYLARAPIAWIQDVVTPTFVIEGALGGNANVFPALAKQASPAVTFLEVPGASHFSVLRPGSEAIAHAILADTGPTPAITLDASAIAAGIAREE